jgi:hypothetical protein
METGLSFFELSLIKTATPATGGIHEHGEKLVMR